MCTRAADCRFIIHTHASVSYPYRHKGIGGAPAALCVIAALDEVVKVGKHEGAEEAVAIPT